jgi:hypothetical protein
MSLLEIDRAREAPEAELSRVMVEMGGTPSNPDPEPPSPPAPRPNHGWQPLAGPALLERLRVTGRPRLKAGTELRDRLRSTLERGLRIDVTDQGGAGATTVGTDGAAPVRTANPGPLVVTKDRLTRVLACEAHHVASEFGERPPTNAMACGAIIDALFRQLITVGSIDDPMADGLAALLVDDRQRPMASWVERLPAADREELRAEVERQSDGLRRRWPKLEPSWLPRSQEVMRVGLAAGAIELSARVDLAIGRPAEEEASVALVEIKAGARRVEHRADLHFYALVEALRSAAPPFVVATYYTRTGELDVDTVTEELLVTAARRTVAGTQSLWNLANGSEPRRTPNSLCGLCVVLPECEPGRTRVEGYGTDGPGGMGDR